MRISKTLRFDVPGLLLLSTGWIFELTEPLFLPMAKRPEMTESLHPSVILRSDLTETASCPWAAFGCGGTAAPFSGRASWGD